tara:strand:- start:92 stop:310 length:219 start_codon:yes stop_codon:yes gene_type:complete
MDANVGALDRLIRAVFGLILLAVPFTNFLTSDWVGQLLAAVAVLIGVTLIASGILARCFVYKAFGINTCRID